MKTKAKTRVSRRQFTTGAIAGVGLTLTPWKANAQEEEKILNFYNWDTYIGETTLDDFLSETGIKTKMDIFADNDELFAKLREGNPGYDVIVPGNDYVERMIAANMIQPLDHDKITNIQNIEPVFRDANFDPGRKFSLPYMWGTIGIGFRKSEMKKNVDSWDICYDSDLYAGQISLLSEAATVIGIGLKYLGYSFNSTDINEIKQAEELIIANKKNIKAFADDNGQDLLVSGEVVACQEWNGDILQVMAEDDDLDYIVPKEGSMLWQDCLCIPNDAPHPNNAHQFINFILDAQVGAKIADFIQYATPNGAAKKLLSDEYAKNPAIFPSSETIARCEPALYLGEDIVKIMNESWTRIQAA